MAVPGPAFPPSQSGSRPRSSRATSRSTTLPRRPTPTIPQAPADPACVVAIVPSDPKDGNNLTRFTFPPPNYHDYDPSWSPLNDVIAWDRADSVILKKQVPWSGNPAEVVVTASNNPGCGTE